jgi:hypothetical protein
LQPFNLATLQLFNPIFEAGEKTVHDDWLGQGCLSPDSFEGIEVLVLSL